MADEYRVLADDAVVRFGDVIEWRDGRREMMTFLSAFPTTVAQAKSLLGAARILRKPSEPSIDPGEGWRLLKQGDVIEDGDEYYSDGDCEWMLTGAAGSRVTDRTYRRRVSRTVDPIHRAYIHRHPSPDEDVLPSMRFAIVCPDGVRRHAATWDEAVAVFDDAVRRECERKGGQS